MLNIETLIPGRRYSFVHIGEVETVGKRKFDGVEFTLAPDWLQAASITRRAVFSGNLAGPESYGNVMQKQDPTWERSDRKPWFHFVRNGIIEHNTTHALYLAVVNPNVTKTEYFVNGQPATAEQITDIQRFKRSSGGMSDFAVYSLEKVQYEGEAV